MKKVTKKTDKEAGSAITVAVVIVISIAISIFIIIIMNIRHEQMEINMIDDLKDNLKEMVVNGCDIGCIQSYKYYYENNNSGDQFTECLLDCVLFGEELGMED